MSIQLTYTQCKMLANRNMLRCTVNLLKNQPDWVPVPIRLKDLMAVSWWGPEKWAYPPAHNPITAIETMTEHGEKVFDYIYVYYGHVPNFPKGLSWSGIAVHYLCIAINIYCRQLKYIDMESRIEL